MRNLMILLVMAGAVAGCVSTQPTCDGKARRPINVFARAQVDYPSCGANA